jgi:hypothetical protein
LFFDGAQRRQVRVRDLYDDVALEHCGQTGHGDVVPGHIEPPRLDAHGIRGDGADTNDGSDHEVPACDPMHLTNHDACRSEPIPFRTGASTTSTVRSWEFRLTSTRPL